MAKSIDEMSASELVEYADALKKQSSELRKKARNQARKEQRRAIAAQKARERDEWLSVLEFAKQITIKSNGDTVTIYEYLLSEYKRTQKSDNGK